MTIRKIQFIHTLALAGLILSLAYSPLRADETKNSAPTAAPTAANTASPATTAPESTGSPVTTNRGGLLPGETREQKRERLLKGIEAQVGPLAPAQKTHILAVFAAAGDEMEAARADTLLTQDQQDAVIRRVHSEIFTRISAALTLDQQAKLQESHGAMGMGRSMSMGPAESLEQRRQRLLKSYEQLSDLTVKQKSDLMALTDTSYKEMEAVNGNAALTSEQKQDALRKIHRDTTVKINAVLSKPQRTQWQKIQTELRQGRPESRYAKDGGKTTVVTRN